MKKKIVVIGNSYKFIKILNSIYPRSVIKVYSWRNISNLDLKKESVLKNINIILICGYDYKSQWYSYNKYYLSNITKPLKLTQFLSTKKSVIIYINTISKIKENTLSKNKYTLSRYEFAKKELAYKLSKNFKLLKILEMPVIENINGSANIHGGIFTLIIFNFLIYLKLIKTISVNNIKKLIIKKIDSKNIIKHRSLKPIFLNLPRPLIVDRMLRFIFE